MPGGAGNVLTTAIPANWPPGNAPRDQEAPGSIALLHTCAARDDTSVPTVSARAPPAGQVAMHPTPDAIRHEQPLQRNSRDRPANASRPFRGILPGRAAEALTSHHQRKEPGHGSPARTPARSCRRVEGHPRPTCGLECRGTEWVRRNVLPEGRSRSAALRRWPTDTSGTLFPSRTSGEPGAAEGYSASAGRPVGDPQTNGSRGQISAGGWLAAAPVGRRCRPGCSSCIGCRTLLKWRAFVYDSGASGGDGWVTSGTDS